MFVPLRRSSSAAQRVPTMADVAAKAGVSPATVSRTINHPEKVCASRRERVWKAIEALGYVLNIDAQRLRIGRPGFQAGGR